MQEETNEKTIALYIKTGKLTAQQLQKAMKALLAQMKKQHDRQKIPHGKQTLWNAASRYLHANLPKGTKTLPIAEWEQEYADLKTQRDSDYAKLKDTRADVSELQKIRKCVDIALRADQPEQTQTRTKRHDIDR